MLELHQQVLNQSGTLSSQYRILRFHEKIYEILLNFLSELCWNIILLHYCSLHVKQQNERLNFSLFSSWFYKLDTRVILKFVNVIYDLFIIMPYLHFVIFFGRYSMTGNYVHKKIL